MGRRAASNTCRRGFRDSKDGRSCAARRRLWPTARPATAAAAGTRDADKRAAALPGPRGPPLASTGKHRQLAEADEPTPVSIASFPRPLIGDSRNARWLSCMLLRWPSGLPSWAPRFRSPARSFVFPTALSARSVRIGGVPSRPVAGPRAAHRFSGAEAPGRRKWEAAVPFRAVQRPQTPPQGPAADPFGKAAAPDRNSVRKENKAEGISGKEGSRRVHRDPHTARARSGARRRGHALKKHQGQPKHYGGQRMRPGLYCKACASLLGRGSPITAVAAATVQRRPIKDGR